MFHYPNKGIKVVHLFIKIYLFIISSLVLLNIFGCGAESGGNKGSETGSTSSDNGSATISWEAPKSNENGSALNDLAGYKIYYGISSRNYTQSLDIGNFTGVVINNLSPGMWCFAVTAYDDSGNESKYSKELCKKT